MPRFAEMLLEPRKSPVQARSTASVEAVLEATIQVLLSAGRERLTTTLVAQRAGVSVGTLYQYFPNKSALLQAVLRRHLAAISDAVSRACNENMGRSLRDMTTAYVNAFLEAKMQHPATSVALYAISSDIDGARISQQIGLHTNKALARMLASAPEGITVDPTHAADMLQAALAGVSRRILESPQPEKLLAPLRTQLLAMTCAYTEAISNKQ